MLCGMSFASLQIAMIRKAETLPQNQGLALGLKTTPKAT
jgi:hypothetical protein